MDREIPQSQRRRRVARTALIVTIGALAVFFLFSATVEWLRPSVRRRDVQTARVERGSIQAALDANGTVVPRTEQSVSSPLEARVLRVLRKAGEPVAQGDELLTLDTESARTDAARFADRVALEESKVAQLRLAAEERMANVRALLEQKRLDAEILHYTAQQKAKLRTEGLIAEQEARAAEASAKKADIEVRQLEEALVRAAGSGNEQLRAAAADLAIARRERDESQRQLQLAMLRAEQAGVVTWIASEVGATVRRGDLLARIADLSAFRIEGTISDVHAARLAPGLPTRVRIDRAVLDGTIESVDPRIVDGVAKFQVALNDPSDARLRHNLRVDLAVLSGSRSGSLVVRRGALGRSTYAFVVRGDELRRVPVQFGVAGDQTIEILKGLAEGDEVVISDMTDYEDVAALRLR